MQLEHGQGKGESEMGRKLAIGLLVLLGSLCAATWGNAASGPEIDANVHVRDLSLDHEPAGGLYFEAVTKAGELHLLAHARLARVLTERRWSTAARFVDRFDRTDGYAVA